MIIIKRKIHFCPENKRVDEAFFMDFMKSNNPKNDKPLRNRPNDWNKNRLFCTLQKPKLLRKPWYDIY